MVSLARSVPNCIVIRGEIQRIFKDSSIYPARRAGRWWIGLRKLKRFAFWHLLHPDLRGVPMVNYSFRRTCDTTRAERCDVRQPIFLPCLVQYGTTASRISSIILPSGLNLGPILGTGHRKPEWSFQRYSTVSILPHSLNFRDCSKGRPVQITAL